MNFFLGLALLGYLSTSLAADFECRGNYYLADKGEGFLEVVGSTSQGAKKLNLIQVSFKGKQIFKAHTLEKQSKAERQEAPEAFYRRTESFSIPFEQISEEFNDQFYTVLLPKNLGAHNPFHIYLDSGNWYGQRFLNLLDCNFIE